MKIDEILFMYQQFLEKQNESFFPYDLAVWINENFVSKGDHRKIVRENEKLKLILDKLEKNWKEK